MIEAGVNVLVGYGVAVAANYAFFTANGIHVTLTQNVNLGLFMTAISLIRSYALRRLFNKWHR